MKKIFIIVLSAFMLGCGQNQTGNTSSNSTATTDTIKLSDSDIVDAYTYLLGRDMILKQERLDFEKEGFQWNKMIYRTPGGVAWANPNLDVAYSEAWVLPNPLKRYLLNKQSGLKYNADGSLTLLFAPKLSVNYPVSNWLPTLPSVKYNLTFRFYGPMEDVTNGTYFPPKYEKQQL